MIENTKNARFYARFLCIYARICFIYRHLRAFCLRKIPCAIGVFLGIMGCAILQKSPFFGSFYVVWGTQSHRFDPNFDPNLTLTRFFEGQNSLFRIVRMAVSMGVDGHKKTPLCRGV